MSTHENIYYKRITNIDSFDAYTYMIDTWKSDSNVLGTDFNLYSTLEDVLAETNPWTYCNYDGAAGIVAFPRDCGPLGNIGGNWNGLSSG